MKKNYVIAGAVLLSLNMFGQEQVKVDTLQKLYEIQEVNIHGKEKNEGPITRIDAKLMQDFNKMNVVDAVNLLPGVGITQMGARNEGSILVRGFNSLRTPVFYDGIPIYTPYDGNFDLSRFTTFDINSISVEKGLVSVQYGPNTMGGAVNIISRKPVKVLDIDGQSGVGFADGAGINSYFTSLNIGTRQKKYYLMGSASILKIDNYVISRKFDRTELQPSLERENSGSVDVRLSAKFGYTPNKTDEYSLSVLSQNADKNISPNAYNKGNSNWRDYPIYDKRSVYIKTKTLIAPKTFLNFTGYYDTYYNKMKQYDDNTYTLLNKNSSFSSVYDDYSLGGILNLTTEAVKNNVITLSVNNKYDSHTEYNEEILADSASGQKFKAGEPEQNYKDNTFYVGVEDVVTINSFLKAVIGASFNSRNNIKAQEYGTHYETGEKNVLYDFPKGSDHALDYKGGIIIEPFKNHIITASASKRSRFASQKERYSSRFGSQVPNPGLKSEYTWAYDITYSAKLGNNFNYEISGFINTIRDAIFARTVGTLDNGNPIVQNVNIGKAVFQGYELALNYKPMKNITLGANYSYIDMKDKTEGSSEKFTDVPNHKMMAYTKLEAPSLRSVLNINVEFYGKRYITSTGDQAPEFTLVNAKLSVNIVKGVNFDFGVRNLLDRNYYLSYGYPKEGRSFITALNYHF
ncbi:iron complex outermembrane receptor protein [Chryseobacterium sediminis]|uniref:Iron complex outermembrane receptor protein n=1 Tax=Chryseobacterium sediminis TaxID=1679494 RepID=A0ABR6Q0W4_9FLAO|nr:TonB-dependent receptor plug domain-containing protein [Chryseobacterium sediminis]MBB6330917.1 iron complex outermembrane receptor protein [Chryseobacterium sediminis]